MQPPPAYVPANDRVQETVELHDRLALSLPNLLHSVAIFWVAANVRPLCACRGHAPGGDASDVQHSLCLLAMAASIQSVSPRLCREESVLISCTINAVHA